MFEQMTVEEAYRITGTSSHSELANWLGKTRQAVRYYEKNGVPLAVEREIKIKLSDIKAARAEARKLKKEYKL